MSIVPFITCIVPSILYILVSIVVKGEGVQSGLETFHDKCEQDYNIWFEFVFEV
jgi:hypothetical protein